MSRRSNKLSSKAVAALTRPGRHGDGAGLYLKIDAHRKRWVFRYVRGGRAHELGLGASGSVTLAEARKKAHAARELLDRGIDPLEAKKARAVAVAARQTFGEVAGDLIEAKATGWRNAEHRRQWRVTLETHAAPLLSLPVDAIDTPAVVGVLTQIWGRIPETASRLRGRIESVLDAARARGLIDANRANPARWKGHLDKLLPKRGKLSRGHHAAMPYHAVPALMVRLRDRESIAALALEFVALTACRSSEATGARWSEIDFEARTWIIPAERMKAGIAHRVPLSDPAVGVMTRLAACRTGGSIFPGAGPGTSLSGSALRKALAGAGGCAATVHGLRSAFKDWASDCTLFQREVVEAALAHAIGNATEAAYRRTDALEKRRALMEAWAAYLANIPVGNVVKLAATRHG